jgi:glycosyltransferase involved in cell wall biosynthesis
MRICHVVYIPRLSGAEILVRDLVIQHSTQGNQVLMLSLEPPEESFTPILQTIQACKATVAFPDRSLGKLSRLKFLKQSLGDLRPDARLALMFSGIASVPVVTVLHDASQDDYASTYFRSIEKFLKPSEHVVALTEKALSNYKRRCGARSQVSIISNGVDLSSFQVVSSMREKIRSDVFSINQSDLIYLQVGRFNQNKQQHLSIKAFIQACEDKVFNGKLFFAGLIEDQKYFLDLQKMVAYAGLQERITFLGPRSDISDLLSAADVYLMPSLVEAHSIAFLEALASGITMVVSDILAFEKGKKFSGVITLQPEDTHKFAKTLAELSQENSTQRWERDLSEFSIKRTADAYFEVFISVLKQMSATTQSH